MNYYLDTEFHEYYKQPKVCGIKTGKPIPTIDLISIGIVSDDVEDGNVIYFKTFPYEKVNIGRPNEKKFTKWHELKGTTQREYYAISKDFDIDAAWNEWQWKESNKKPYPNDDHIWFATKEYWLRENVLKPILKELWRRDKTMGVLISSEIEFEEVWKTKPKSCRGWLRLLVSKYGKTNKQIAKEIKEFVYKGFEMNDVKMFTNKSDINFYSYYADYDWVVFAQLFGNMINLPKGFPKYCRSLKQMLDEQHDAYNEISSMEELSATSHFRGDLKEHPNYPKKYNEYNALDNAKWNKELHKFINTL